VLHDVRIGSSFISAESVTQEEDLGTSTECQLSVRLGVNTAPSTYVRHTQVS